MSDQWFAQCAGNEFGPMTEDELLRWLLSAKRGAVYVWRQGQENWLSADQIPELKKRLAATSVAAAMAASGNSPEIRISKRHKPEDDPVGAERRIHARHSLVATISLLAPGKPSRVVGTCVDISVDGIQIAHSGDWVPAVDEIHELEIHPLSLSGVPLFRVAAQVKWASDGHSGFIFKRIDPKDQSNLDDYQLRARKKLATF